MLTDVQTPFLGCCTLAGREVWSPVVPPPPAMPYKTLSQKTVAIAARRHRCCFYHRDCACLDRFEKDTRDSDYGHACDSART